MSKTDTFAVRLDAVNAQHGGRALPEWLDADPIYGLVILHGGHQPEAGRHAWAGWVVEWLGLEVHVFTSSLTRDVEVADVALIHTGRGTTLADACLSLLEKWEGPSPFGEESK